VSRRRDREHLPLSRQPLETTIDGFSHGGEGVARLEGKAVFVPGALPGERVLVRVVDDRARWALADLLEVLEASPDRVVPPCPFVPECGGCDLQHAHPDAQRRLKTRVVREQLARLGGVPDAPVEDCRAVGPDRGYRTHAQFHAGPDGRLGFHRRSSHDVVPVDRCLVLTVATQAVRDAVGDDSGAAEVAVRAHPTTDTAAAVITPGPGPLELPTGAFDVVLVQPDGSSLPLRGDGQLREQVAGLTFTFPADAFFQVTTHGAEALVAAVLEATGDVTGTLVWDLYCGVGLLALPLARAGAEVVAVEGFAAAAEAARDNAAAANLDVEVHAAPVRALVERAVQGDAALEPPEVVVLDPPRSGAGREVIAGLVALAPPTIVYVACDVAALARDTRQLVEAGYRLTRAVPLDLFPMTHHVEVVATFAR
jgi:tRNA/tmRNA/rRNA uracil-C5-methylase (TrmA/RlmC/RlmD family)